MRVYFFIICVLLFTSGGLSILLSSHPGLVIYHSFLESFGASLVGVSVGIFFTQIFTRSDVNQLFDLFKKQYSILNGFQALTSDPGSLQRLEGRWYCYTVSPRLGEVLWKVAVYQVRVNLDVGTIAIQCPFADNFGRRQIYHYSGIVRDDRVIFIGRPTKGGEEPSTVQIFHYAGKISTTAYAGITFHQTWGHEQSISPSMISREPLFHFTNDKQASEELSSQIDKLWGKEIELRGELLLPRIIMSSET